MPAFPKLHVIAGRFRNGYCDGDLRESLTRSINHSPPMKSSAIRLVRILRSVPSIWVVALIVVAVLLATTNLALYLAWLFAAVLILNGLFHVGLAIKRFFLRVFSTVSAGIGTIAAWCRVEKQA